MTANIASPHAAASYMGVSMVCVVFNPQNMHPDPHHYFLEISIDHDCWKLPHRSAAPPRTMGKPT